MSLVNYCPIIIAIVLVLVLVVCAVCLDTCDRAEKSRLLLLILLLGLVWIIIICVFTRCEYSVGAWFILFLPITIGITWMFANYIPVCIDNL